MPLSLEGLKIIKHPYKLTRLHICHTVLTCWSRESVGFKRYPPPPSQNITLPDKVKAQTRVKTKFLLGNVFLFLHNSGPRVEFIITSFSVYLHYFIPCKHLNVGSPIRPIFSSTVSTYYIDLSPPISRKMPDNFGDILLTRVSPEIFYVKC